MNNFTLRMITVICGSTFGIFMVSYNTYTIYFFFLSIATIAYMEYIEVMAIGKKIKTDDILPLMGFYIGFLAYYFNIFMKSTWYTSILYMIILGVNILNLYNSDFNRILAFALGLMWIFPSIHLSIKYALLDNYLLIYLYTIIFLCDGLAYIAGKLIGKIKLASSVSPNKTIEGTICGITASIIGAYIISFFYTSISQKDLVVLGILCGIFGQIGDLIESAFKRWIGVKDSGTLIYGHGGILDRFDSPLVAIPIGIIFITFRGYY